MYGDHSFFFPRIFWFVCQTLWTATYALVRLTDLLTGNWNFVQQITMGIEEVLALWFYFHATPDIGRKDVSNKL